MRSSSVLSSVEGRFVFPSGKESQMKYAIISDIHGNLPVLEKVLADARSNGAESFLFLGDYCTSAPWGSGVTELIRSLPASRYVRGNEEHSLHMPRGEDAQFAVTYWSSGQLKPAQLSWLDSLSETSCFECEGTSIHMAHASSAFLGQSELVLAPWKLPLRYPHGNISRERFLDDARRTLAESPVFQTSLSTLSPGVYIFGHTHIQWHARFGDRLLINPGSCGISLDCTTPGAPYTLLTVERGQCTVEERRVSFDVETLIAQVRASGQYAAAPEWSELIFEEWRTGRERVGYFLHHAEQFAQSIGDSRRPFAKDTWERAYEFWKKQKHP